MHLWNEKMDDIVQGYKVQHAHYQCLMCPIHYKKGRIYQLENGLFDAEGAIQQHIKQQHHSIAAYLLQQELSLTGLTEIQKRFLELLLEGKNDKEISQMLNIAPSTVRNHRFKLREKEKQAKLVTALMMSIERETQHAINKSDLGVIEDIHMSATMIDDRYTITEQERKKTIETYLKSDGTLKQFPTKEKKKIIVLGEIMKQFSGGKDYTEKEVDTILKQIYVEDYPTLRRALIEYGFMERSVDCKIYKVKGA